MSSSLKAILDRLPDRSSDSLPPSTDPQYFQRLSALEQEIARVESLVTLLRSEWREYLDRIQRASERERKSVSRSRDRLSLEEVEPELVNGETDWVPPTPQVAEPQQQLDPEARAFLLLHPQWGRQ